MSSDDYLYVQLIPGSDLWTVTHEFDSADGPRETRDTDPKYLTWYEAYEAAEDMGEQTEYGIRVQRNRIPTQKEKEMDTFKLLRICSNCGKMYEQGLDNYMRFFGNGKSELSISSNVLKMDWNCFDCIFDCILELTKEEN